MNKKGISTGAVVLIIGLVLAAFVLNIGGVKDLIIGEPSDGGDGVITGNCPSSGLTEVTINTQEALASTATNANCDYYIFEKDGTFVTTGSSGSDGQSVFNLQCAEGKTYDALVLNETTLSGYYAQEFIIDASGPTFVESRKMYEYGEVNFVSVASSVDPLGAGNVSSGLGKTCGFTVTFTENESASAFNRPLILCEANSTSVADVTMSGVTEVPNKRPSRLTASTGQQYFAFELNELYKSTDAAKKIDGKITFSNSVTPGTGADNDMTCKIIDQATYKKAEYQTLTKGVGFVLSSEDDSVSDIGGPDSISQSLEFVHSSGYC